MEYDDDFPKFRLQYHRPRKGYVMGVFARLVPPQGQIWARGLFVVLLVFTGGWMFKLAGIGAYLLLGRALRNVRN